MALPKADAARVDLPKSLTNFFFIYAVSNIINSLVGQTYLMFFITEYTGVTLGVVAAVLTSVRLLDVFISFIAGTIVQKTNTKIGAFRPWIIACPVISSCGFILCFSNPDINLTAKLAIIILGYLMSNLPGNFLTTAQNGLQTKIAGANMDNRLALSSRRIQGMQMARLISAATSLPLINWFSGLSMNGYLMVVLIHSTMSTLGAIGMFIISKPYDKYVPDSKKIEGAASNVKVSQMYIQTLKNPQMWVLLIVDTLKACGLEAITAMNVYYFTYSAGNMNFMTVAQTAASLVGFGAAFIAPPVARKLGKKGSNLTACGLAVISYLGVAILTDGRPILFMVFSSLATVGLALYGTFGVNLFLDAAEYQLYKTGQDSRSFVMSLNGIPMKIGMLVSSPVVAVTLSLAGYSAETGVADTGRMVFWTGAIPVIFYGLAIAIFAFFYKITDAKAIEYAEANKKTMAERAAAARVDAR